MTQKRSSAPTLDAAAAVEEQHAMHEEGRCACRGAYDPDVGCVLAARLEQTRNAIERHRARLKALGVNAAGEHGGPWDRDLWAVLDA